MQRGRKRLQHCKGSLVGQCQKHDGGCLVLTVIIYKVERTQIYCSNSVSWHWQVQKDMSRNAKPDCPVILSILIGLEGLCDDQSDYVILIDSDYVRKWNDKRVKCGKSLLIDIFSHMKREKNPRHFAPKVKCKKRVTCGNSLLFYIFSHMKR